MDVDAAMQLRQLERLAAMAIAVVALAGCGFVRPTATPTIDAETCRDWMTAMSDAARYEAARFFVDTFSGSGVAPSVASADATARRLVVSMTAYCAAPPKDIVAGLGDEALRLRTAAALLLQVPSGPVTSPR